jgi:uncharacterized OB-fold protein
MEYKRPLPQPTPETQPFWDGLKQHELRVMHCNACGLTYLYPRPHCPRCLSEKTEWRSASGRGKLHTFGINYRPARGFEGGPYVIAVVELEEGPRLMSNLVDVEPDPATLRVDMPLEIVYDDVTDEVTLPKFRPGA